MIEPRAETVSPPVRVAAWRDGHRVDCSQDLRAVHDLVADPQMLIWIDLDGDPQALAAVGEAVGLDPHALEDAVAPGERPKATRHRTHTFFTVYGAVLGDPEGGDELHETRLNISRVAAFVLPTALITVRPTTHDRHFDMTPVEARWAEDPQLIALGVGALVHGLLDVIVDQYFETIQQLDDAAEDLEDLLWAPENTSRNQIQQRVYRMRKELVGLRRVVLPMRDVAAVVMRFESERESSRELDGFYQDLNDHVMRASEWTDSLLEVVGTIFDTNLSLQDSRLNQVMKKLAGWAAVVAVPTAITGWFGQNVPFPAQGEPASFYASVATILIATGGVFALLRHEDWI